MKHACTLYIYKLDSVLVVLKILEVQYCFSETNRRIRQTGGNQLPKDEIRILWVKQCQEPAMTWTGFLHLCMPFLWMANMALFWPHLFSVSSPPWVVNSLQLYQTNWMYPLALWSTSSLRWPFIVSFPSISMVIFHTSANVYQRLAHRNIPLILPLIIGFAL